MANPSSGHQCYGGLAIVELCPILAERMAGSIGGYGGNALERLAEPPP